MIPNNGATVVMVEQSQAYRYRYDVLMSDGTLLVEQTLIQVGQLISEYGFRR